MAEPTDAQINASLYLLRRVSEDPVARLKILALMSAVAVYAKKEHSQDDDYGRETFAERSAEIHKKRS